MKKTATIEKMRKVRTRATTTMSVMGRGNRDTNWMGGDEVVLSMGITVAVVADRSDGDGGLNRSEIVLHAY